jgi:NADPH:quinone reductase
MIPRSWDLFVPANLDDIFAMKVISFHKSLPITDPEGFLDLTADQPLPGPRDFLVEVRAISVNPIDAKIRAGSGPGKPQSELSILGWDAVGVAREVGTEVTLFKPGDEIYCPARCPGSYAEFQCVDERIVRTKPGSLDFAAAAALPLTTITHGDFYLTVCALCRMAGKAVYSRQDRGHGGA